MNTQNVDLEFLAKQSLKVLEEIKSLRKDVADVRTVALQTYEFSRRVEKRQMELRDDLEVAIKIEFGGGFAHLQTATEALFSTLSERLDALSEKFEAGIAAKP
jgi:ABC-type phosphate transport system auxiliary subunit